MAGQTQRPAVVMDNGSDLTKVGYSGEEMPRKVFSTLVGRPKESGKALGIDQLDYYVGQDAETRRSKLRLNRPVVRGEVGTWQDLEDLWDYMYANELRIVAHTQPCLITEEPLNSKSNREKAIEVLFESFDVPAFFIGNQAVLSLYTSGLTTGLVLESGEGVTHAVPVFEGYSIPAAVCKGEIGGGDANEYMRDLMEVRLQMQFSGAEGRKTIRSIKEKLCYVALNFQAEMTKSHTDSTIETNYTLPSGQIVTVGNERFRCPEALFQPALMYSSSASLPTLLYTALQNSAIDLQPLLLANIVISGGNTMWRGIEQRLAREIALRRGAGGQHISAIATRQYGAWIGGSVLTSLSTFQQLWVSRAEYDEYGPTVVHAKCF